MTKQRSYHCAGCKGEVAIPKGRRNLSLEVVRANHERSCPARRFSPRTEIDPAQKSPTDKEK